MINLHCTRVTTCLQDAQMDPPPDIRSRKHRLQHPSLTNDNAAEKCFYNSIHLICCQKDWTNWLTQKDQQIPKEPLGCAQDNLLQKEEKMLKALEDEPSELLDQLK